MKVAIRDALADLLLEALDDAAKAATLHGLAIDVRAAAAGPPSHTLSAKLRSVLTPDFEADWPAGQSQTPSIWSGTGGLVRAGWSLGSRWCSVQKCRAF